VRRGHGGRLDLRQRRLGNPTNPLDDIPSLPVIGVRRRIVRLHHAGSTEMHRDARRATSAPDPHFANGDDRRIACNGTRNTLLPRRKRASTLDMP
jgi:hypothetical protein